jgi:hypothetical protein
MKLIVIQANQKLKQFGKHIENPTIKRSDEKRLEIEKSYRFMEKIVSQWNDQVTLNEVGFSVKSNSIQTRWYIDSALMRSSIQTFILTLIPSVVVYYVKTTQ